MPRSDTKIDSHQTDVWVVNSKVGHKGHAGRKEEKDKAAGEQIFVGELVAVWQCTSLLRFCKFCWDLARGELKWCTGVTVV
jgi:hypothetical protein